MQNCNPLFARSGQSSPFGKCTEDTKTMLPEEVKAQLQALATINSQTLSEYLRDMCIERVYGHVAIMRAHVNNRTITTGQE